MSLFYINLIKYFFVGLFGCLLVFPPAMVFGGDMVAQLQDGFIDVAIIRMESDIEDRTIAEYIQAVLKILTGLVAIIALVVLVVGGVMYIASVGDDTRARQAKKLILYAIIGLLLIGASALIVNLVISVYTR